MRVLVNATPLIALSLVNRLDLLQRLFEEVIVPPAVYEEISAKDTRWRGAAEIFNPGSLQPGLTVEKLLKGDCVSTIRNRKIADIFKEVGLIEKYGTGIRRILNGFRAHGLPAPKFEEISGAFRVTAYRRTEIGDADRFPEEATTQATTQVDDNTLRLLQACREPATLAELMHRMGLRSRKHFRISILGKAMKTGLIEWTAPDKPQSPLQRYRLTEKGKEVMKSRVGRDPGPKGPL